MCTARVIKKWWKFARTKAGKQGGVDKLASRFVVQEGGGRLYVRRGTRSF